MSGGRYVWWRWGIAYLVIVSIGGGAVPAVGLYRRGCRHSAGVRLCGTHADGRDAGLPSAASKPRTDVRFSAVHRLGRRHDFLAQRRAVDGVLQGHGPDTAGAA